MSKKEYSAKEVAIKVIEKVSEMIKEKEAELNKAEKENTSTKKGLESLKGFLAKRMEKAKVYSIESGKMMGDTEEEGGHKKVMEGLAAEQGISTRALARRSNKQKKISDAAREEMKRKKIAKKKGVPKDVNPEVHERCVKDLKEQGKDKSSAYAICNAVKAGKKKKVKKK